MTARRIGVAESKLDRTRKLERECGTLLFRHQLEELLEDGRVILDRVGEEHDGQQVVIRIWPASPRVDRSSS